MDEFGLIGKYFAPLTAGFPGGLGLKDDAALLSPPTGHELVATMDAISAGVHFIGDEDASLIARKLLRVNLSDLAAMGAKPWCYFLALMLPSSTGEKWFKQFAKGLRADQLRYGIHLAGGDTTATRGGLSLAITALGLVRKGAALKRSGARPGDAIYVSGTIGDAALWLKLRDRRLVSRYQLPEPRLALGQALPGIASAGIDVSDGLMQDLGHICAASHVGADIERGLVPLSPPVRAAVQNNSDLWPNILGGGDDYELVFTVPKARQPALMKLSEKLSLPCTRIGFVTKKRGLRLWDEQGKLLPSVAGFRHF